MTTKESHFNWLNLLLGVLFILTSLASFQDPTGSLASLTIFMGMMAILKGIFDIFLRNKLKELTGAKATLLMIAGILDVILGLVLLFNIPLGIMTLPYLFAAWFLVDSISGLFSLNLAKSVSTSYYWFNLIINVIGIFVGFSLLFDPIISALTLSFLVGFYLMWFGIMNIVEAFIK